MGLHLHRLDWRVVAHGLEHFNSGLAVQGRRTSDQRAPAIESSFAHTVVVQNVRLRAEDASITLGFVPKITDVSN